MTMRTSLYYALTAFLLHAPTVQAEQYQVKSGTGFFISKSGYILTNHHVVAGCKSVMIRGAVPMTQAAVIKTDSEIDLALLKTTAIPPRVAVLRVEGGESLSVGDPLLLIGYPEEHGRTGIYDITPSKVISLQGPLGGDRWIQFEDAARQGNSGGPLLDGSGHVVGVVMGKSQLMRVNPINGQEEQVGKSDLAISLPYVWQFLQGVAVQPYTSTSGVAEYTRGYLEQQARDAIVNIHCRQD